MGTCPEHLFCVLHIQLGCILRCFTLNRTWRYLLSLQLALKQLQLHLQRVDLLLEDQVLLVQTLRRLSYPLRYELAHLLLIAEEVAGELVFPVVDHIWIKNFPFESASRAKLLLSKVEARLVGCGGVRWSIAMGKLCALRTLLEHTNKIVINYCRQHWQARYWLKNQQKWARVLANYQPERVISSTNTTMSEDDHSRPYS